MKISIDTKLNIGYIALKKGRVHKTKEINPDILVDLDKKGNALGFEILNIEEVAPLYTVKEPDKKKKSGLSLQIDK